MKAKRVCVLQEVHAEEEQTRPGLQQLLRPAPGGRAGGEGQQRLPGAEQHGGNPLRGEDWNAVFSFLFVQLIDDSFIYGYIIHVFGLILLTL